MTSQASNQDVDLTASAVNQSSQYNETEPLFPLPPTLTGQAHDTEIQLQARRAVIKKLA